MAQIGGALQGYQGIFRRAVRAERRWFQSFVGFFLDALDESRTLRALQRDGYAGRSTGSRF
jgi:hypothetical protein